MSELIEPNRNGMSERQFRRKGQMNVTHDELAEQLKALAKAMLDAFGPIAQLQLEMMARQSAMEDSIRNGTPLPSFEDASNTPVATPEATVTAPESPESRESIAPTADAHDSIAPADPAV